MTVTASSRKTPQRGAESKAAGQDDAHRFATRVLEALPCRRLPAMQQACSAGPGVTHAGRGFCRGGPRSPQYPVPPPPRRSPLYNMAEPSGRISSARAAASPRRAGGSSCQHALGSSACTRRGGEGAGRGRVGRKGSAHTGHPPLVPTQHRPLPTLPPSWPQGCRRGRGALGTPPRRKGESVAEWDTSLRIPTASAASLAGSAATASSQPGGFTGGGGETQRSPPPSKNQPTDPKGDVRGKRRSEPLFLPVG